MQHVVEKKIPKPIVQPIYSPVQSNLIRKAGGEM